MIETDLSIDPKTKNPLIHSLFIVHCVKNNEQPLQTIRCRKSNLLLSKRRGLIPQGG